MARSKFWKRLAKTLHMVLYVFETSRGCIPDTKKDIRVDVDTGNGVSSATSCLAIPRIWICTIPHTLACEKCVREAYLLETYVLFWSYNNDCIYM